MIKIDKFTERNVLKYNTNYFNINYIVKNGIVFRENDSIIESQTEKSLCLLKCFDYYTNSNIENCISCFEWVNESMGNQTRCCCSQNEECGLNYEVVKHKDTNIKFVIGIVCFKNLFKDANKKDLKYFFKPTCKFCGEKVKKNNPKTSGFCKTSCLKKFNDRELNLIKQEEKKLYPYGKHYNCKRCGVEQQNIKYKFCMKCV